MSASMGCCMAGASVPAVTIPGQTAQVAATAGGGVGPADGPDATIAQIALVVDQLQQAVAALQALLGAGTLGFPGVTAGGALPGTTTPTGGNVSDGTGATPAPAGAGTSATSLAGAPGGDGNAPVAIPASVPANGQRDVSAAWVSQWQGLDTSKEDCGPSAMVELLLAMGITPHDWDPANPAAAVDRARRDMGLASGVLTGGTNSDQVIAALATYTIGATYAGFDDTIAAVRGGRPAMMAGNTRGLPYQDRVANPDAGVDHFLTIAGYDAASGRYIVLDPDSAEPGPKLVSEADLRSYWDASGQPGGVVLT